MVMADFRSGELGEMLDNGSELIGLGNEDEAVGGERTGSLPT